jgi:fermentation-respiration switch protein FrsA (DUF1100 family)
LIAISAASQGWGGLRKQLRPASVYLLGLILFGTMYGLFMSYLLTPEASASAWRRIDWRELLVLVYFLIAIKLLLSIPYSFIQRTVRQFDDRWLGPSAPNQPPRRGHGLLPQVLPSLLLLPLILPYVLAALQVHRYKVANLTTPLEQFQHPFEDVQFQTADGLTIRGWFVPTRRTMSSRTLLICHGIGANRSNFLSFLMVADELQANALIFDFRGHGDSDGHTVTFGHREKLEVLAAVNYLRTERPEQCRELLSIGISLGSSALIRAAVEVEPPFDGLIIDSGFTSAVEMTDGVLRIFPPVVRPWLVTPGIPLASLEAGCRLTEVRSIDQIQDIRCPVLFIHARGDEMIPVSHGQRLFERAIEPKRIWISKAEGHSGSLSEDTHVYLQTVARWHRECVVPPRSSE